MLIIIILRYDHVEVDDGGHLQVMEGANVEMQDDKVEGDASKCHCYHEGDKGGTENKCIRFQLAIIVTQQR